MPIYPELFLKKCVVSTSIHEEYQRYKRTTFSIDKKYDTIVLSSSLDGVDASFALALFHCLNTEKTFDQLLCVYSNEEEYSRWSKIARSMSSHIKTHHLCVVDQIYTTNVSYFNVVFIGRPLLRIYFKHDESLQNITPFVDDDLHVFSQLSDIDVIATDVRCVNSMPYPLDYKEEEFSVYKFYWHALIYPSSILTDFVYDLNMITTVQGARICLLTEGRCDDENDGEKIISLAQYRQLISTFNTPIDEVTNYLIRSQNDDTTVVAETDLLFVCKYHALHQPLEFFIYNEDDDDNDEEEEEENDEENEDENCRRFSLIRKYAKQRKSIRSSSSHSSSSSSSTSPSELSLLLLNANLSPFDNLREIIDFNSSVKINRTLVDEQSNYSMMLIYDQEMIDRLRHLARKPGVVWCHSNSYFHTLTDVCNSRMKCTLIETFIMSQLHKQFYLLSPFVSSSHPLCNFPNVRNLHPTDMRPAHALDKDATLIVFDAIFANNAHLDFSACKCHVIFVVYQHTHEEEELQKFSVVAVDTNDSFSSMPISTAYFIPFTSSLPVRKFKEDKVHLESVYRMALVHFRTDRRSRVFVNLYPLLCRLLDITLAEVGSRFCRHSDEYTRLKYSVIPDLHRKLYVQRCASIACMRFCAGDEDDELFGTYYNEEEEIEIHDDQRRIIDELSISNRLLNEERKKQRKTTVDYLLLEEADGEDVFELHMSFNPHSLAYRNSIRMPPKISTSSDVKALTCTPCNHISQTERGLLQHLQTAMHKQRIQEKETGEYPCGTCEQMFVTHNQLRMHNETYAHKKRLKNFNMKTCPTCNKTMNTRNYVHHVNTAHKEKDSEASYYSHRQTHCTFCGFTSPSPGSLMRSHNESPPHMMRVAPSERKFKDFSLHLNRHYLVFAAIHKFINDSVFADPCCYNILLESRNADLSTLCLIAACIRPTHRCFYRALDNSCGFVSCSLTGITGIIGQYITCPHHVNRPCSCFYGDQDTIISNHPLVDLLVDFIKNEEREDCTSNIDYMPKNLLPFLRGACLLQERKITCIEDIDINFLPNHNRSYISLLIKNLDTVTDDNVN